MKSKILIFLLCVLTFGIFAIPLTFAKDYNVEQLNMINRVSDISFNDSDSSVNVYFDTTDLTGSGYWYISLTSFDDNFNVTTLALSEHRLRYATTVNGSVTGNYFMYWKNTSGMQNMSASPSYSSSDSTFTYSGNMYKSYIYLHFHNSTDYNNYKASKQYTQVFAYRSSSNDGFIPINKQFVSNDYYGLYGLNQRGFFQNFKVELCTYGVSSRVDVSDEMISYNRISFNSLVGNVASNNNINTNQYYLRIYFNDYVRNLVNLDLSYLEITGGKVNGSVVSRTTIYNLLPLYSNITLYNSNAKLFNTDVLTGLSSSNYYIDYIEFDIANYSFKSSSYYNSNLGIYGYIDNTFISALNASNTQAYKEGVDKGFSDGYLNGYNDGYQKGYSEKGNNFDDLFYAVGNVPMTIISSVLNFEILGFNLLGFFMGIITLLLFVRIVRKFKE